MDVKVLNQNWNNFNKSKLGLDKGFGFAKIKVVNPTALSVRRDGGLIFYE